MGAIFAVMRLNSGPCGVHYRERARARPDNRDLKDPEGQLSSVGGCGGSPQNGVRVWWWWWWGLRGHKEERDHKHSTNDLKQTNSAEEINESVQMKKITSGANVFFV